MKYSYKNIDIVRKEIYSNSFNSKCRINEKDYIRKRKVTPRDIVLYELNRKGLSTKMEIINFNNINDIQEISSPGLFKQREKLNPEAFIHLIRLSLKEFYTNYKKEVKTYKGYVLLGIDGSDFEIPNTKKSREKYNGKQQEQPARITVSTCCDLLNYYTLDSIIEKYDYSEIKMAETHYQNIKQNNLLDNAKSIIIMDRNYRSLSNMYKFIKNDDKFLIRITASACKKEQQEMKTDDEIIEIKPNSNRTYPYRDKNPELYNYLLSGNSIKVRCVKVTLNTGETEVLLTNLEQNKFSKEEIKELYNYRWKIEINYKHLKNNLKIECISSSKITLIKQDIFSQVLVSNMLQAFINDNDKKIKQEKYKNPMKTNNNMSVGIFKNTLIYILLENDIKKRGEMMDKFCMSLEKYILPIKKERKNPRTNNIKNRYNVNQRKSF